MKALVVDDDSISRMVLVHLLSSLGIYDVEEANDGETAWLALQSGLRPAICFCDGRMPRLSGLGLLKKILAEPQLSYLPFVLVSASEEAEAIEQVLAAGAAGYIVKPFELADVRAQLNQHVKQRWTHVAEHPATTLKRLNLQAPQLAGYLQAFQHQLELAVLELESALEQGNSALLTQRLNNLQHACLTLGLTYAASELAAMSAQAASAAPLAPASLRAGLSIAQKGVEHQTGAVREMLPPAGGG